MINLNISPVREIAHFIACEGTQAVLAILLKSLKDKEHFARRYEHISLLFPVYCSLSANFRFTSVILFLKQIIQRIHHIITNFW
jgi:hypothetical protein